MYYFKDNITNFIKIINPNKIITTTICFHYLYPCPVPLIHNKKTCIVYIYIVYDNIFKIKLFKLFKLL